MGPLTAVNVWTGQVLAQLPEPEIDPDAAPPEIAGQEQVRSFVETLVEQVDNVLLRRLLRDVLGPGLQIVFVLTIALVAVVVLRRVITRAVARAKDPHAPRGRRLKRRVGIVDDAPTYSLRRAQRADALGALASSIATAVIWVLATFLILAEIGVNLAPLVAGAGVVGLAIGFGAQNLVSDFLSGVFMLAEDQFGVGDDVDVGDDVVGVVEGVTLRTTRVRDVNGTLWHVPNGEIRRVGNSSQEWARSLLDISVAYETDVDVAIEVIGRVATEMSHEEGYAAQFLTEPSVWGVQALGPDAVDIRLVIKTTPGSQWGISRELRRRIKAAFDTSGIEMPYPQRTVWLRQEERLPVRDATRSTIEEAIAGAGDGDPGADHAAAQDQAAVAEDVEETLARDADADPATGTDAEDGRG